MLFLKSLQETLIRISLEIYAFQNIIIFFQKIGIFLFFPQLINNLLSCINIFLDWIKERFSRKEYEINTKYEAEIIESFICFLYISTQITPCI